MNYRRTKIKGFLPIHYKSIQQSILQSILNYISRGGSRIRGGPQIVTGLKLPFWGLNFVEFWCWGLIFGDRGGGAGPRGLPLDPPLISEAVQKFQNSNFRNHAKTDLFSINALQPLSKNQNFEIYLILIQKHTSSFFNPNTDRENYTELLMYGDL